MLSKSSWHRQRRLALWTALAAVVLGVGAPALVQQTNLIRIAGFPLGFYLASQGVLVALAILLLVYARLANRIDRDAPANAGDIG